MGPTLLNPQQAATTSALAGRLAVARSTDEAFDHLCDGMAALGFPYVAFITRSSGLGWMESVTATNYPSAWILHYVSRGYLTHDPVRSLGLRQNAPFTWDELQARLSPGERVIFPEARAHGLAAGISVPVHDALGLMSGISFATSDPAACDPRLKPMLGVMGHLFSHVYEGLARQEIGLDPVVTDFPRDGRLTSGEATMLRRAAHGASDQAIAAELAIPEAAVDLHFRVIAEKLNTPHRVAAVVKALKQGWIF